MNIKTHYEPKPIPMRHFDWSAIDDGTFDGADDAGPIAHCTGYGATEAEAIADLKEQLEILNAG